MCYTQYLYHHRPILSCHQMPRRQVHQGFGVFRPSKESCFRKTILSKIAEREEEKIICQCVLLVGHTDEINLTGRLSTRLARGMGTDHATATFHTLLPTDWSPPFGLDSAGTTGEVEITENGTSTTTTTTTEGGSYASSSSSQHARAARAAYALGVSIGVAEPPFHRTKVISIMPRFVVVNLVGRSILVKLALIAN